MSYNKFYEMLELQDKFNDKVALKWREKNFDFINAMLLEGGEGINSLAWKWWKKADDDMDNFKVEMIDVWHFLMSQLQTKYSNHYLAEKFAETFDDAFLGFSDIKTDTQRLCYDVLSIRFGENPDDSENDMIFSLFTIMKGYCGIKTVDDLYNAYIVKNVLNKFRQDNGYKDGSYIKIWDGEEDNVHAYSIISSLNSPVDDTFTYLYEQLDNMYKLYR